MSIYIKSSDYLGYASASNNTGSGWMMYNGNVMPNSGVVYTGSGFELAAKNGSLRFTTVNGGGLVIYDRITSTTPMLSTVSKSVNTDKSTTREMVVSGTFNLVPNEKEGSFSVTSADALFRGSNVIVSGAIFLTGSLYYQGRKQYNFGQFYDTTTQSGSRNTPYAMKFNTTDISEGVSITSNGSGYPTRITVANSGYYNLQFSAQLYNTNNSNLLYTIWFRVNGTDIPNSATNVEVVKNAGVQGQLVAAWNFLHYLSGSQYVEIMWAYNDGSDSGQLLYLPSSSLVPHPAIPSIIATVTQVS